MELLDTLVVVEPLIQAFERLGISYYIGGSVTSSVHGIPRATVDVDLVADIQREHVPLLVNLLESAYYIDRDMINEGGQMGKEFNKSIELDNMFSIEQVVA
jgi:hypothetical protein